MSYLALYREFRPTDFSSLIGQEHVVRTLVNQIKTGKIGHAYLFCGARGTGKTTAAKIFARAINCLSPVDGSPCGKCEACKKLESPSNLDVLEMDAASNNKVENVRELRDKIQYPPVAGRYKVYIVDEVHMLTTEAFNALLKTLEEPPEHAVFILATTEAHKLPSTILSRCMRFDFKLVPTERIAAHVRAIYDKIGKKYQPEAVDLIARAGEGSVRDALSVADVCLSYGEGELTYDDVLEVLGTADRAGVERLIGGIFDGDCGLVLSCVETLCSKGKSAGVLNRDVCSCLRDLLVVKTCKNAAALLGLPEDKFAEFSALAERGSVNGILRTIEIFSAAEADLKYSTHPKIVFETAAVKASMPQADYNLDALLSRMSKLEKELAELKSGAFVSASANVVLESGCLEKPVYKPVIGQVGDKNGDAISAKEEKVEAEKANLERAEETISFEPAPAELKQQTTRAPKSVKEAPTEPVSSDNEKKFWGRVLRRMRADKAIMLWVACQDVTAVFRGQTVVVCAAGDNEYNLLTKPDNAEKLKDYVKQEGAADLKIVRSADEAGVEEETVSGNGDEVSAVKGFFGDENLEITD